MDAVFPSLSYPNLYPYCFPGLYILECLLYLLSGYLNPSLTNTL